MPVFPPLEFHPIGALGFPLCEYPGDLVYTAALVANAPLLIRLVVIVETAGNWLEINEGPFCGVLTATENWLDKMVPGLTVSPYSTTFVLPSGSASETAAPGKVP